MIIPIFAEGLVHTEVSRAYAPLTLRPIEPGSINYHPNTRDNAHILLTRGYIPNGQNEKAIRFLHIDYDATLLLKSIDASAEMKYVRLDLTAEWIDPTTGKMLRQAKRDNLILPSTGSGTYGVEL